MRVAHHQRAVRALHDDQVNAVAQALRLFHLELCTQALGLGQGRIAFVAHHAQVAHDGTAEPEPGLWLHAQHLQLALLHTALGPYGSEQVTRRRVGADGYPLGAVVALCGAHARRVDLHHGLAESEVHALRLCQPCGQPGDGGARLHAQLVRAVEHRLQAVGLECGVALLGFAGRQQLAARAHVGLHEGFQHRMRRGAACGEPEAGVEHVDTGLLGDVFPDVSGAQGACPVRAGALPGHGDEAEVANRCAHAFGVAFQHQDLEAPLRGGVGVGEADNARTDHDHVVVRCHVHSVETESESVQRWRQCCVRFCSHASSRPISRRPTAAVRKISVAMAAAGAMSPASSIASTATEASVVWGE